MNKLFSHVKYMELDGLDHDSAQNYDKPGIIAQEIKNFINEDKKY